MDRRVHVGSVDASAVPGAPAANPLWIAIGAASLDLVVALIVTSLLRVRLGYRVWRVVHWLAYLSWPLAFAHSLGMGSDASALWFRMLALASLTTVDAYADGPAVLRVFNDTAHLVSG